MPKSVPAHVAGLLAYLACPAEKANEDRALNYFRTVFGDVFTRQKEARRADGYVAGHFVLELKGSSSDWLSGFFQALAYRNMRLDFSQVVVGAKDFLAIWSTTDLDESTLDDVFCAKGPPSSIGKTLAKKYAGQKSAILGKAVWRSGVELSGTLFTSQPDLVLSKIGAFEQTLRAGRKVRESITLKNFTKVLREMVPFFDSEQPIKAVRAFYNMLYSWSPTSTLQLSKKASDQATLDGEVITNLRPSSRHQFKDFVENHAVHFSEGENYDDFFARFDKALDAVDPSFRIKHGIYFTDLDLSRFVMWLVKQGIPNLGKNYFVIDPACGSGNLVTNWRSPLELRHKVVSEIEPELLFAVEKRMKGDQWHHGKFTVVPKVSENKGLNFLDCSAEDYLKEIKKYLAEKGFRPDKPLAFLCNPPYRSDEDQTATPISYKPHSSILQVTGPDAANERYCCFLAQMKLISDVAPSSGLPGESLLLLFTKSAWLTKRAIFDSVRNHMLGVFEDCGGVLVNGKEFFDVKGSWPIAFTWWRYKGKDSGLDSRRSVRLRDLTWVTKTQLAGVHWDDSAEMERACQGILNDRRSRVVEIGKDRISIRQWSGETMVDFKRDRRKAERNQKVVGGLPARDRRQSNKKAYGESDGSFIGFMDDLTLCRVKNSEPGKPWFRLNSQFMDFKRNRCLSGPPTHWGYCARDLKSAERLFFWYALARTFIQHPYPMWVDAEDIWAPNAEKLSPELFLAAFAIAYAENECVQARFPANNPVQGAQEIFVRNPMTPLDTASFWSVVLRPRLTAETPTTAMSLVEGVDELFNLWRRRLRGHSELPISRRPYLLADDGVSIGAGLVQIRDYAREADDASLLHQLLSIQELLTPLKANFFEMVTSTVGLDYFGAEHNIAREFSLPDQTKFQRTLAKRLAVASILVQHSNRDVSFGRTKLAKLFYLADTHERLRLETEYAREAAGPLDARALYNETVGIESLAAKYGLFSTEVLPNMVRYRPSRRLDEIVRTAPKLIGAEASARIGYLATLFRKLDTDQSEIVATLYACWNDLLIRRGAVSDEDIISEFLFNWHVKKARFSKRRLVKALAWMRENALVPAGRGKPTNVLREQ